jgi:L-fucose isomerase-like protein
MLWVKNLLDETPWMANPARVDVAQDRLLVAHCAVPLRMVASYRLRSHFESGRGAAIQGELPLGPVTIFRIGGASMDLLWIAEGETQTFCHSEAACRTQAEIRLTSGGTVQDLTRNPLGNHLVLLHGRHADRLRTWWETMIAS